MQWLELLLCRKEVANLIPNPFDSEFAAPAAAYVGSLQVPPTGPKTSIDQA